MDKPVVVWEPSNDGPRLWSSFGGEWAALQALAYLSGVCRCGSYVASVGDTGGSIVILRTELVAP